MNIVICDNESEITFYLKNVLEKVIDKQDKIWCYESDENLKKDFGKKFKIIDILFMDIKLKNSNGINFVKKNKNILKNTKIIYITGYDEFIEDTFETEPLYVLRKPLSESKVIKAYHKALEKIKEANFYIIFKTLKETIKLKKEDILYLESKGRILEIHTNKEIKKIYAKLSDFEKSYHNSFLRIHKSFLVNISKIKIYRYNKIILENDEELSISRTFQKICKEKVMNYMEDTYA